MDLRCICFVKSFKNLNLVFVFINYPCIFAIKYISAMLIINCMFYYYSLD